MPPLFVCFPNLRAKTGELAEPWKYDPGEGRLAELKAMPKRDRRELTAKPDFQWQIYSAVRGAIPTLRVGSGNEAHSMNGLALDYDVVQTDVDALIAQIPEDFRPTFLETTLSNKLRPVWLFERPILVMNSAHAAAVIKAFVDKFKLATAFAGFDEASCKPEQVWTNGASGAPWAMPRSPGRRCLALWPASQRSTPAARTTCPSKSSRRRLRRSGPVAGKVRSR